MEEIGLFGLGRQARRRSAALDVDDDEREFRHHGETDGFLFKSDAGTRCAGQADVARERRADGGADGGDLVFGLEGFDAEVFAARQFVQDVAGGRDRIRAVEERTTC